MNKINRTLWDLKELMRKTGLNNEEIDNKIEEIREKLIKESYEKGLVENLVNIRTNLKPNVLYIGDMKWIDDYEILTGVRYYEGHEFTSKEEYEDWVTSEVEEKLEKYRIEQDEEDEDSWIIYDDEGFIYDDGIDSEEVAEEMLEDLKEDLLYEYPEYEDLEYEYDEIYWNYVYGYDYIDESIAQKCGLGVLELNSTGEKYLFLRGCGMDMSFQLVQYQALYFGAIDEEYVDKLGWTKINLSKEEYIEVLEKLGVDTKKLGIRD